ncbi:MAG: GNVR domain-containing protein [Terriglobia bacterium]
MPEQEENLDVMLSKLLGIAARRRWWVLIPAAAITICACLVSQLLPNRFESEAVILVESPQVPERYVTPNSNFDMREVLLVMTDAVLSRTRLLQIIDGLGLYAEQRERTVPENLVALMRSNIKIEPMDKDPETTNLNTFKISFTSENPHTAQQVTKELTTLFIDENNKSREEQSTGTTNFLEDQLKVAEEELRQREGRVKVFKMNNLGELPEQQGGILAILSNLHSQLQNAQANLSRTHEQQVYLQSLLTQYQELAASNVPVSGTTAAGPIDSIKAELVRLDDEKRALLARYTAKYPDVVRVDEQIKETEALLAVAIKARERAKVEIAQKNSKPAETTENNPAIAQLKSQLEANAIETQNGLAEQKDIQRRIEETQRHLNLTPVREEQLTDLLRGYEIAKQNYDDLLNKKTQSELATSLLKRQQGQRFHIIDQPNLPSKPSKPARVKISLGGLAAGIAIGIALAFFMETKDHSFREEAELRRIFPFPLVLGVPLLLSKADERKQLRAAVFQWIAGTALCLLMGATEFYVYWRG